MIKDKTKILKVGNSKYFLIPHSLLNDSSFPFKPNDKLAMRIFENRYIVIQKQRGFKKKNER